MAKNLVGLELNSTELRIVNSKGDIYYSPTPSNFIDSDGDLSVDAFSTFLKNVRTNSGIKGKDIGVVLSENATYYRTLSCPAMNDEQIKLNLPFEFKNYVGPETTLYNYDYIVDSVENDENGKPKTLNLTAAAGLKSVIDGYEKSLEKANVKLTLALPKEICLINLMKAKAENDKEYCLIGVGYEYTNVYMFKGSNLIATKAIDIGNREIDTVISQKYNVDEHEAITYRNTNKDDCLNGTEVSEIYGRIALEVMKTVNFYKYENNDSEIDTAYFFDMGVNNEKMNETICKEIEFKKGDINELLPDAFKGKEDAARFLVGIGLVL